MPAESSTNFVDSIVQHKWAREVRYTVTVSKPGALRWIDDAVKESVEIN